MSLLSSIKKRSTLGTDTSFKVPAVDDKETLLNTVGHLLIEVVTANGSCTNSNQTPNVELGKLVLVFLLLLFFFCLFVRFP